MKRLPVFLVLSLVFFFVFACDLQLPKEIEIVKQSPELRFDADMKDIDLDKIFGDLEKVNFGNKIRILTCDNTNTFTLLVYIDVPIVNLKEAFDNIIDNIIDDIRIKLGTVPEAIPVSDTILVEEKDIMEINSPELPSAFDIFAIDSLDARLFISGSNNYLLDALAVNLSIGDVSNSSLKRTNPSNIPLETTVYNGTSLPAGGHDLIIDINEKSSLSFEIYLKQNEALDLDKLKDGFDIKVELAIWFPFEFTAKEETELKLPFDNIFNEGGGDLFGRASASDESFIEMIDSIYFEIVLNENPFPDSTIILRSRPDGTGAFNGVITGNKLSVSIDKDNIIYPFNPSFSISFNENDRIIVPSVFSIEEFAFKAKVRYTVDISNITDGWKL